MVELDDRRAPTRRIAALAHIVGPQSGLVGPEDNAAHRFALGRLILTWLNAAAEAASPTVQEALSPATGWCVLNATV